MGDRALRRSTIGALAVAALSLAAPLALTAPMSRPPAADRLSPDASARMQAPAGSREGHQMNRVVEIRSYNLKSGTRERFHQRFLREALPMLRRWKIDVVAYGPSLHDGNSYYLMRSYSSVEDRQRSEDAFYGSDEWKQSPREAILADIESYATVVIGVDDVTLQGLRRVGPHDVAVKEHAVQTGFASRPISPR